MKTHSRTVCSVAAVLLATCLSLPCAASSIPNGDGKQSVDLGGITLEVLTYRPKKCTPSYLLLVFHGLHRNVENYRDDLRPIANQLCMLELVPLFDEERFPSWRYQKGGIAHRGKVLPPDEWTGNLAIRLVEWARTQEGQPQMPYIAVGHSAGAQFLSRFAAFTTNDARAIVVANPSTHVLPSLDVEAPFGFMGAYAPDKAEAALREYLARPLVLALGKDDLGDKDRDDEPDAVAQGKTRYERGMNTFAAAKAEAARRSWPFGWQLVEISGVGHSAAEVFSSKPVKAAIRDAVARRGAWNARPGFAIETAVSVPAGWSSRPVFLTSLASVELPKQESQTQQTPPQKPAGEDAGATQKPAGGAEADKEVKITPREAEQLFHSVDEILEFDSKQTGLPIKREVKRKLTSREEVVSYLTKHMDDEDAQRLRRSELVLKKFGLLPRDFDLEKLLVALLKEQVAGYYDPKTKTVNLLDWVPVEQQEPVMAHELTHALQDQAINLDRWMKKGDKDLAEIHRDPTPLDIENDEIDDARQAVVEGQAEAVMLQYALAPVGRSIIDSPDLVDSMESEMSSGTPDSTVFKDAPIFLKESLTFPYSYGLEFVVKLLQKGGREKAFAEVLHNPPHTTRQIMEPETYLSGERIEPMAVPEFKRDFKDYQKFDIGAMGEFDVAVLVEQYAGKALSKRLYPEWRGGYYYAARPKADAAAPLGLLYVSRWSSEEKAEEFAEIYARSLKQRYSKAEEVGDPKGPADKPMQNDQPQNLDFKIDVLKGRHVWTTDEGTVVIEERGDTVFVSESLDSATTGMLEKEVFGK